jgi:hypothetical protein
LLNDQSQARPLGRPDIHYTPLTCPWWMRSRFDSPEQLDPGVNMRYNVSATVWPSLPAVLVAP